MQWAAVITNTDDKIAAPQRKKPYSDMEAIYGASSIGVMTPPIILPVWELLLENILSIWIIWILGQVVDSSECPGKNKVWRLKKKVPIELV